MATTTPNYGWPVPTSTDYVKDGAAAIEALGDAIDATVFGLGSGLTLVQTQTVTGSTGVSFTGLTVGKTYKIITNVLGSVSLAALNFRFRENSTDKASSYYGSGRYTIPNGTVNSLSYANIANFDFMNLDTTQKNLASYDMSVISSSLGLIIGSVHSPVGDYVGFSGCKNNSMSAFNGFSIYPSTGTMTGTIKLYSYQ
jgi:hypothetical protein